MTCIDGGKSIISGVIFRFLLRFPVRTAQSNPLAASRKAGGLALSSIISRSINVFTAVLLSVLIFPANRSLGQTYSLTDLGDPIGTNSYAQGINNQGQVVGYWDATNGAHAFLYQAGGVFDLGLLGLGATNNNYALSINNAGQVVGFSETTNGARAFLYQNGAVTNLGSLGGAGSYAFGINQKGQIVGYVDTPEGARAILYNEGNTIDMGTLGGTNSFAFGINNSLQVAGTSLLADNTTSHAFLWQKEVINDLNQIQVDSDGWELSDAHGINDYGNIVGWGLVNHQQHAFLFFNDGTVTDLGVLTGGTNSYALGLNNSNQVVGASSTRTENHAVVWQGGIINDLNDFINISGWELREACGINDLGQIVGWGTVNEQRRAFLLTPNTSTASKKSASLVAAAVVFSAVSTTVNNSTNLAVTVRHAPSLNSGTIQGSLQQLNGECIIANGGFAMTGDLLVPGTPTLVLNGKPTYAGTIVGSGSTSPSGYQVILNGNCSLRYLRTRTAPVSLPTVAVPPAPKGTRCVNLNSAGQSYGEATTLRDLTLNGNVGMIAVPPGTYGTFTVNGGSGLVLGVTGAVQAVSYNLQNLNLNGNSTLKIVGPVGLTVANGFTANGTVGASNNPAWLQLQVASGGFTLNGGCTVYGQVLAPNGTVIVNGNSTLVGTSASDQFILNGSGLVCWGGALTQTSQPPTATAQSVTLAENSATNLTLTGSDSQGKTLTFTLLTAPTHGTTGGTPPSVTYKPATNYFGGDSFTFKVNNGVTDSLPATVSLTVTQVYYLPTALAQSLTNWEDTALPLTLTGSDPQGHALTYTVLTSPAHGTLSGTAPSLIYQPATNYFGNDSFTFRVNDGVSNSLAATISITNRPVDDPPVVKAGPDQLIIWPGNSVSLAGLVTYDVFPGTVDTVRWSQVGGPGSVVFSNSTSLLTTATFSQPGVYRLRLSASDSFLSGSNDMYVTVDAPPVVSAGQTLTNTFPGTITLAGSASDDGLPTNGTLKVTWSRISGPGTVVFGNAAATNSTATFGTNGVYVLRLTADDGIATNHSEVTVVENRPPVVNAGGNILTNGLNASLNGSVTDDGLPGGVLAVQWSQISGPGTITFGHATATNTAVTASQSGTYVLALTATDGAATNASLVTVIFNLPPVVNAGPPQTVNFGTMVTLAGTVTDDSLPKNILTNTWSEVSGPGKATFANASLTNTTVTFDQPGIYTLRLTAGDTLATTAADVVIRVNAAPLVHAGTNQLVALGTPVTLAGSYTDDGISGQPVTTLWTQVSGPAGAVIANAAATNTSLTFSQGGVYVFQLTASDGLTNGSAQVVITVDQTPVVTATTPLLINWPTNQVVLNGTVTDDGLPNGGTLTAVWSQISGPGTITFSTPSLSRVLNGAATVIQPTTAATFTTSGAYVLRLTGSDGLLANHADVVVTVNLSPTVNAGTNQTLIWNEGAANISTPLAGMATDDGYPNGTLTTTWSVISGPGAVNFGNANATSTTATFSTNGTYVLQLTANDGSASSSSECTVTIERRPLISIIQPTNNVVCSAAATLTNVAVAFDLDAGVTNVQFFDGTNLLGTAIAAGTNYAFVWTNALPGSNSLTAVATDNNGLSATSAVVNVIINGAPVVNAGTNQTLIWIEENAHISASLAGMATDDGYPNGTLTTTWSVTSGPGTASFGNANAASTIATFSTNGTYVLQLTANDGSASSSSECTVTIERRPFITIAQPTNNTTCSAFTSLTNVAAAYDLDGSVTNVQFFDIVNGITNSLAGVVSQSGTNYTLIWTNAPLGSNSLTAVATDNNGLQATSAPVMLKISKPTVTVQIVSPIDQSFPARTNVCVSAVAASSIPGVVISQVRFFWGTNAAGTNFLGVADVTTNGFYQIHWRPLLGGQYVLTAQVIDSRGSNILSAPVTNTVWSLPGVTIISPTNGQIFLKSPTSITIQATTIPDPSTSITNVTFYQGASYQPADIIGISTSGTANKYAIQWNGVTNGTYILSARAVDANGSANFSAKITVTVETNQPPSVYAGPDQTINLSTNALQLVGLVSDDGLPYGMLTVWWTCVSGPTNVVILISNQPEASVCFQAPGIYRFCLAASDGQFTACSTNTITVSIPNQAPLVDAGTNQTVVLAARYAFTNDVVQSSTSGSTRSSRGKEFWIGFLKNYEHPVPDAPCPPTLDLFITSQTNTSGDIGIPGLDVFIHFTVKAGQTTTVSLPSAAEVQTSDQIEAKGIHVTSKDDITIYGLTWMNATADAFLGLPVNALGTNYIDLGWTNSQDGHRNY
jgi:probable HAF family extracellular repeat protein